MPKGASLSEHPKNVFWVTSKTRRNNMFKIRSVVSFVGIFIFVRKISTHKPKMHLFHTLCAGLVECQIKFYLFESSKGHPL